MEIINLDRYRLIVSVNSLSKKYRGENSLNKLAGKVAEKLAKNRLLSLEEALSERKQRTELPDYLKSESNKYDERAVLNWVNLSALPHGNGWEVRGMYDPTNHTMYVANDLPVPVREYVKAHEEGHSFKIHSEIGADNYAAEKVGFKVNRAA